MWQSRLRDFQEVVGTVGNRTVVFPRFPHLVIPTALPPTVVGQTRSLQTGFQPGRSSVFSDNFFQKNRPHHFNHLRPNYTPNPIDTANPPIILGME